MSEVPAVVVRRAEPEDAVILAELGRRTYVETFVEDFAIPYPPEDLSVFLDGYTAQSYAARIADADLAVWVAEAGGKPVGYAIAGPPTQPHPDVRPGDGELRSVYVARSAQGLGVGRRLLDTAFGWLEREGPRTLWLGAWSGNARAIAVYQTRGFEVVGESEYPVGRWRDREVIMRRVPAAKCREPVN